MSSAARRALPDPIAIPAARPVPAPSIALRPDVLPRRQTWRHKGPTDGADNCSTLLLRGPLFRRDVARDGLSIIIAVGVMFEMQSAGLGARELRSRFSGRLVSWLRPSQLARAQGYDGRKRFYRGR